jgi:hypothetical protein
MESPLRKPQPRAQVSAPISCAALTSADETLRTQDAAVHAAAIRRALRGNNNTRGIDR